MSRILQKKMDGWGFGNEINNPLYTLDKFRDRNFFSTLNLNFIWNH